MTAVLAAPTIPAPRTEPRPVVIPAPRPATTCLGCDEEIPAGDVWCSWLCRNLDDRHDWEPGVDD